MGKGDPAPPPQPQWHDSEIIQNGQVVGKQYMKDGKIVQENILTPEEQKQQDNRNKGIDWYTEQIPQYEQKMDVFSPSWLATIDKQIGDYTADQTSKFNDVYTPAFNNIIEQSAQKFGTTNNSWYADELAKLAKVKADTLKSISQQGTQKRQEFQNNEISNRTKFINQMRQSLASLQAGEGQFDQEQAQDNASNLGAASAVGSFDNNIYNTQMSSYNQEMNRRAQQRQGMWSSMFGGIGALGNIF